MCINLLIISELIKCMITIKLNTSIFYIFNKKKHKVAYCTGLVYTIL